MLVGLALMTFVTKAHLSPEQLPYAMAALTSLSLAASPVCWTHYQIMQYPGIALLLCYALQKRQWRLLGITLPCAALLYPVPVAILTAYYEKYGKWTAASPMTLYVWTSVAPLAALALFGLLVHIAAKISQVPIKHPTAVL